MPRLEDFLIENRFTPAQVRFSELIVKKIFQINHNKNRGVTEKELLGEDLHKSPEFIRRTLERLATTKAEDMDCPVLACINQKWFCVTTLF